MLLTQAQFARARGVNRSTVTRWVQSGRVRLTVDGLVDPTAAEQTLDLTASPYAHHQARAEQHGAAAATTSATAQKIAPEGAIAMGAGFAHPDAQIAQQSLPLTLSTADDASLRLKVARAKREEEEAQLSQMRRMAEAKLLLPRSAVEFVLADLGRTTASLLDRIADRYTSPVIAAGADAARVHAVLAEAARDIRTELEHHAKRKAEGVING